jgi:protein phosphatase
MLRLIASATTDVGLRRSNNEDAFLAMPEIGTFSLADGMGGAAAGEVASEIFVATVGKIFTGYQPADEVNAKRLIQQTFLQANERMLEYVREHPEAEGMGCTGELLTLVENQYIIGHVGDSRVYLFRDGYLRQLTKDHSLVQEQIDQGLISRAEARNHSMKNIVLRALGIKSTIALDLIRGKTLHNDIYLLCSDGLSDLVEDTDIESVLGSESSIDAKVEKLIERANAAGGKDNITVIVCKVLMD